MTIKNPILSTNHPKVLLSLEGKIHLSNSKLITETGGMASIRGGSRAAATSKMEHFVIIVNGFQPLTIITKCSTLDVAAALDPPLSIRQSLSSKVVSERAQTFVSEIRHLDIIFYTKSERKLD